MLSDNSIWSFPSVSSLSDLIAAITACGGPEGDFNLAIIVFGAFQFVVLKYCYRLGKMEFKESSLLIKEVTVFKVGLQLQLQLQL